MSKKQIHTRNAVLISMIVAAALLRLVTYKYQLQLSNFTPMGAIALFGGCYFNNKWKAYLVPVFIIFVSDIVINYFYTSKITLWTNDTIWMCLCFSLIVFLGTLIKKINIFSAILITLLPVLIHWLVMDLPFLYGNVLDYNITGYVKLLTLALPFEKNMLLGDIFYGLVLFGGFELIKRKYSLSPGITELAV